VPDEAKGGFSDFLRTLGLIDLVTGALALYAIFVWVRGSASVEAFLPSTGTEIVDLALLACVAALIGKIIGITTQVPLALLEILAESSSREEISQITTSLAILNPGGTGDALARGAQIVSSAQPDRGERVERFETDAQLLLSAVLLAIPYGALLISRVPVGSGWIAVAALLVTVVLLVAGAFLLIAGRVEEIRTGLEVLAHPKT
jgi:hypothetical protein